MNQPVKIGLYVVLIVAGLWLAMKTYRIHTELHAARKTAVVENVDPAETNVAPSVTVTNTPAVTNAASSTNTVGALTNATPQGQSSSIPVQASNTVTAAKPKPAPATLSALFTYGFFLVIVIIALGMLIAFDFSRFAADRFHDFVLNSDGMDSRDPEYERAEQVWADGHPLDAIQLMRDYLKRHPRELYVSIRIAEIYEKDLGNYLAAALEYEEVLKHNLRPEQWGWAAVHLANIYSGKLKETQKAVTVLKRIDNEHPGTAAAAKARSRLKQLQDEGVLPADELLPEEPPPSHLPKGFRAKGK